MNTNAQSKFHFQWMKIIVTWHLISRNISAIFLRGVELHVCDGQGDASCSRCGSLQTSNNDWNYLRCVQTLTGSRVSIQASASLERIVICEILIHIELWNKSGVSLIEWTTASKLNNGTLFLTLVHAQICQSIILLHNVSLLILFTMTQCELFQKFTYRLLVT